MINSIVRPGSNRTNIREVHYKNKLHSTDNMIRNIVVNS